MRFTNPGLAYARSLEFYETTILWQWLRFVGDVPFALAALLMAFDFIAKLGPMFPQLAERLAARYRPHGRRLAPDRRIGRVARRVPPGL